ncbi:CAAX protease self-immunity [Peptoclostridium litorale DSM 5388]|uniref:Abortive infection protein n=1 Tax=Peptoclostridium litorale DSM 5388 TaxID=1121324 RepID=A0A069RFD9_PEPLI|nr:type II CAAX endopeptidase family protein [Peptoclostridium litorale]KDR95749.1 abortive infection protein [Peptoclostridium litorale DSM 5388]SIO22088.1 CAAX protease self-immunity [Peptoclostridium litorale DSM 5388]
MIDSKKVSIFMAITFLIDWGMALLFYTGGWDLAGVGGIAFGVGYMLVPGTVAIFVRKFIYKEKIKEAFGISFRINRWFFIGWIAPAAFAFLTLGISILIPGVEYSPNMEGMFERFKDVLTPEQTMQMKEQIDLMPVHPIWMALVQGLLAGVTINAVAAFGEELGWRGFLLEEFKSMGFWKASLAIGFIWGVWHAPLILQGHNYPQHPKVGVIMMIAFCMLFTPLLNYIRIKSKSVIAVSIAHGTLNGVYGISIMLIIGGNDLLVGITGIAGFAALAAINTILLIYDRYLEKEPVMSNWPKP